MIFSKTGLSVLTLVAALVGYSTTASAQFDGNSNAPTTISADKADYQGEKTILTGAVDVRQGDVRILADKMTVFTSGDGGLTESNFNRIIAEGNFYYLNEDQEVRGESGVYTKADDTFLISGGVILKQQDGNVVTGDKLYYNLTTRHARVVGTCEGRKCGSTGRVNILIKNTSDLTDENS